MASACINNGPMPPAFAPACPSYGFLSPMISLSHDGPADGGSVPGHDVQDPQPATSPPGTANLDDSEKVIPDFEFRLDDPVMMLPADELFSDGKLVPLHVAAARPHVEPADGIRLPEAERPRRVAEVHGSELCAQSPRAPRSSSRWRKLLGLKKQQQNPMPESQKVPPHPSKSLNANTRSLCDILQRRPKPSSDDCYLNTPLLNDSDSEPASVSITARRSLSSSSSSSGADHDELLRFSFDAEKPSHAPISLARAHSCVRLARPRGDTAEGHRAAREGRCAVRRGSEGAPAEPSPLAASVDSPRMNASGKVVFQGLESSSSSPGSFHHRHRGKPYRGMERSYSVNLRVVPVLNVLTVGSLRVGASKPGSVFGLGHLFSLHKTDSPVSAARRNAHGSVRRSKIDKEKA
ncbi:unnamed protein product [Musa hybrid cultivar]